MKYSELLYTCCQTYRHSYYLSDCGKRINMEGLQHISYKAEYNCCCLHDLSHKIATNYMPSTAILYDRLQTISAHLAGMSVKYPENLTPVNALYSEAIHLLYLFYYGIELPLTDCGGCLACYGTNTVSPAHGLQDVKMLTIKLTEQIKNIYPLITGMEKQMTAQTVLFRHLKLSGKYFNYFIDAHINFLQDIETASALLADPVNCFILS